MEVGKVSETILKRSVFKQLQVKRDEVVIGPGIGEDCAVLNIQEDESIVLSTDPITGATDNLGELAVHITLNDLAASGAEPIGLMLTFLLPEGYREQELKALMKEINQVTYEYNVEIIGGHSEVTGAVVHPVISVTGVGKIKKDRVMTKDAVKPGMDIVMTKWAGLEGTSILAYDGEELLLGKYNASMIKKAKETKALLSVVKESKIAMQYRTYAMHDVTEGGIFGALWELGAKAGLGLTVDQELIPVKQETIEICEYFDLNPYMLIGSGSLLIVTEESDAMIRELEENGIRGTVIGQMTKGKHRQIKHDEVMRSISPAKSDELYKGLERLHNTIKKTEV